MDIREHMEIVDADGMHVGTVDNVEGDRIKLTRKDSSDGKQHFLQTADVEGNMVRAQPEGCFAEATRGIARATRQR
jgi:hypothetical protein